jgi:DNA (cytosine-5)-methyltransferase 1
MAGSQHTLGVDFDQASQKGQEEQGMTGKRKLRAIDLYAGIGGWSLGLAMAGIDVVESYEWWGPANRTNELNNRHKTNQCDIRALPLKDLPTEIDIVVGSPPCTQFSFSNRGGKGDIEDGLRDIAKFLEIVKVLKPRFWAMENVPRVAQILKDELAAGGSLNRFASLRPTIHVVDMQEFGLPQSRERCIAGNFDFDLLFSYRSRCGSRTLGDVIKALSSGALIVDPIYGSRVRAAKVLDHEYEVPLTDEEERMNREAKTFHPIYNNMSFPDRLDKPVRTITATCTRVSRESVVVESQDATGRFRRLTVRERASLQGFPVTFQFYGKTYQQKVKMVGNAIPPLFTFYLAQAMRRVQKSRLVQPKMAIKRFLPSVERPAVTPPDSAGRTYPSDRRFRAAIPNLRFKSGVRFDLANIVDNGQLHWRVTFYFGNSKSIYELVPDGYLHQILSAQLADKSGSYRWREVVSKVYAKFSALDEHDLQRVWARKDASSISATHPYDLVDYLGSATNEVLQELQNDPGMCRQAVGKTLEAWFSSYAGQLNPESVQGIGKVMRHATAVASGLLVAAAANSALRDDSRRVAEAMDVRIAA